LEVADVFAVNKADQPGADIAVTELQSMIALGEQVRAQPVQGAPHHGHAAHAPALPATPTSTDRWLPTVHKTAATTAEGLPELLAALEQHRAWLNSAPAGQARRHERLRWELIERARAALVETLLGELGPEIAALVDGVEQGQSDPYQASEALLRDFRAAGRIARS
jgi:LAO/AO transport system kinase